MNDYKPFPVNALPDPVARFVRETSDSMQCDPAAVALPCLSVLGASIGTTRAANPRPGWLELPIIWTALIARSGSVKTPGFEAATQPLFDVQHDAFELHKAAMSEYEKAKAVYDKAMGAWKRKTKSGGDPPEAPSVPACVRYVVDDITLEALAPILQENQRGVLMAPDELDGWVQSFGLYSGGRGADRNRWLRLHRKGSLIVDRKTGRSTIYVRPASVCVAGTVQPEIFQKSMSGENTSSGLTARQLLAWPTPRRKKWTERCSSKATLAAYHGLVGSLLRLGHVDGERGPEPFRMELSTDARPLFIDFYNRHGILQFEADDDAEAAALAKLEGYALRLALIFALVANPIAVEISLDAMRRAVALVDWFAEEAARVYARMGEDEETGRLRALREWIERKGGSVTARELARSLRAYPTVAYAEAALAGLVAAGLGTWCDPSPGAAGGRPSRVFRLNAPYSADADNTPDGEPKTEVSSASAESAACNDADREAAAERAAILEFDGGLPRETAEQLAFEGIRRHGPDPAAWAKG